MFHYLQFILAGRFYSFPSNIPLDWFAFLLHTHEVFASNLSKRQSTAVEVPVVFLSLCLQLSR